MITSEIITIDNPNLVTGVKKLDDFKSVSLNMAFTDFVWEFSFVLDGNGSASPQAKIGDAVRFFADDKLVFTGYIEAIDVDYDSKRHDLTFSGRSITCDLVDSTVGGDASYTGKINLRTIATALVDDLFANPFLLEDQPLDILSRPVLRKLQVKVDADINDFLSSEEVGSEMGQSYFEVLEKFSRKRRVILTTDENGAVVFSRGRGNIDTPLKLINRVNGDSNNVKSAKSREDRSKMFNLYSCNSQMERGVFWLVDEVSGKDLYNVEDRTIDNRVRVSRKKFFISENASSPEECLLRSQWEANIARSLSLRYSAVTEGHSYNDEVWFPNKSVEVIDEFAGHNARFLIDQVNLTQDLVNGSETRIICLPSNSFTFPEENLAGTVAAEFADVPLGSF